MIAYEITNTVNGKRYIGITKRPMHKRWAQHLYAASRSPTAPLHRAIQKYGSDAFTVRHIASAKTYDDLYLLEEELVTQEGTYWPRGYNATRGGEGAPGYHPPPGSRPPRMDDLTGKTFGRLTVVGRGPNAGTGINAKARWYCRCSCGTERLVHAWALKSGNTVSCGCQHRERAKADGWKLNRRHGMTKTPTWICWDGILQLCKNTNHKSYSSFGGRGIRVCDRWLVFENFLADMGERPKGMVLIRKDPNGHYEPGNCRWGLNTEKRRNTRRNRMIEFNGETRALAEWAERYGISRKLLGDRIRMGWPMERAVSVDPRNYHRRSE